MDEEDHYMYYGNEGGFNKLSYIGQKNRSGQIPAFGNWDYANDLPITQYFECARQAGLIRHSSSSGECDCDYHQRSTTVDLYAPPPPARKTRVREKRCPHVKEQKKAGRICDVTQPPTRHRHEGHADRHNLPDPRPRPCRAAARPHATKAVDEDLYKIPPELLHSSNRKKRLGFISRCLVPVCSA